jgi:hypothetical protein
MESPDTGRKPEASAIDACKNLEGRTVAPSIIHMAILELDARLVKLEEKNES